MSARKVFHLLPEDEWFSEVRGGAVSRVVENLVREDAEAVVVCSFADETWNFPRARIRTSLLLRCYSASSIIRKTLLKIRPLLRVVLDVVISEAQSGDVVWVHNRVMHAILLSRLASERGFDLVLHMHNNTGWKPEMASLLSGARIVFVSQSLAREAIAACPGLSSVEVLHNGADPEVYYPPLHPRPLSGENGLQVLFVGRLIPEKGVHVLLNAMRMLRGRSIPARARVVGSVGFALNGRSAYADSLVRDAPDNVTFEGYKSGAALAQVFREADVFCCPSVWSEPFGLVLVEALATGIPVVATNGGGIPEVLAYGGGVLVPQNDAQALANALEALAGDKASRLAMGRDALSSFAKNFTRQVIRERYRTILGTL